MRIVLGFVSLVDIFGVLLHSCIFLRLVTPSSRPVVVVSLLMSTRLRIPAKAVRLFPFEFRDSDRGCFMLFVGSFLRRDEARDPCRTTSRTVSTTLLVSCVRWAARCHAIIFSMSFTGCVHPCTILVREEATTALSAIIFISGLRCLESRSSTYILRYLAKLGLSATRSW